ncbi:MAG TPA: hypothetical protein DHV03_02540 [Alphaproteobacteria bacterium]|jgi:Uncharacterized membrane protein, required for colicin V production|nr:hypothetical protein [Paracoccaceae bacterium]RCL81772.1 MAG: CvpA family protein [SAR116 cluster bacterium]RPH14469.1 MAG: CvpA family protein [Alphaproteobacteria bacterium TMED150]HBQ22774.1 hypothetical protein [Alphaproteobacteria bacterium]HCJ61388.1 hypothetical protein [Alphaproteobacteria bacterium]|tara:strand:- start:2555 stop:3238 length:684 start_codon:yes stop_codon:yes gene_type:complete
MEQIGLTLGDVILAAIMLLSGLLAFIRGFIREALGLVALALAIMVTVATHDAATSFVSQYLSPIEVAEVAAGLGVFIISWFVFAVILRQVGKLLAEVAPGIINRSLGFAFGLLRGLVIVAVIYLVFDKVLPGDEQKPDWISAARFKPMVEATSDYIAQYLPKSADAFLADTSPGSAITNQPDAALDRDALQEKLRGIVEEGQIDRGSIQEKLRGIAGEDQQETPNEQ